MRKRPGLSIVWIGFQRVTRADFSGDRNSEIIRAIERPRPAGGRLDSAVATILSAAPQPGAQVLVLSDDLWCHALPLPSAQAASLTPQETADALAYEIEPFSNLPPAASAVAFHSWDDGSLARRFWVVQCTRAELAAVREAVRSAGSRLLGLTHPAGVPRRLGTGDTAAAWRRVEHWARGTVVVDGDTTGEVRVDLVGVGSYGAETKANEVLCGGGDGTDPERASGESINLKNPSVLNRWLSAWAQACAGSRAQVALIRPPQKDRAVDRPVLAGLAASVALLLICWAHYAWTTHSRNNLRETYDDRQAVAAQAADQERRNQEIRVRIAEARAATQAREEAVQHYARRREALSRLLEALEAECRGELMIERLRTEGPWQMRLVGLGLSAVSADDLSHVLAMRLRDSGWQLDASEKSAQGVLEDGGPWRFSMRLKLDQPSEPSLGVPSMAAGGEPW